MLHVLRSSLRASPERAQEFLDTASANPNIRHPAILPVYEAGEYDGTYFYAREFVVGRTVYEIKASGLTITETTALQMCARSRTPSPISTTTASCTRLSGSQASSLRLTTRQNWPTSRWPTPPWPSSAPPKARIRMVGRLLSPMTKATAIPGSGRVLTLIHQMQTSGAAALTSWAALAQEAKKLSTLVDPPPSPVAPKKAGVLEKVKFWSR